MHDQIIEVNIPVKLGSDKPSNCHRSMTKLKCSQVLASDLKSIPLKLAKDCVKSSRRVFLPAHCLIINEINGLFSYGFMIVNLFLISDYAFGRCLPLYEENVDTYRYQLKRESLHQVKRELERLMRLGYHWGHLYTQCILKVLMSALRYE